MKKHWITLSLVAVVIIGAVTAAFFLSRPQGNAVMASVQIAALQESEQGVALETAFSLTSEYSLSEQELRAMLAAEPGLGDYTLSGGGKEWTLIPSEPLKKNTVYTFSVKNNAGEIVQSFAFQSKSDLAVNTVYPADKSTRVLPDAGIEITFNATGVNVGDYFEIKPEVAGTFETNDYAVIFKPAAPLSPDNIYRVTLKAGLSAPNGMALTEDYNFSFETTSEKSEKWDYTQLRLAGEYSETFLTGDPLAVQLSSGSDTTGQKFDIKIHKYADINDYINELKAHDAFYLERYGRKAEYVADTKSLEETASLNGELFKRDEFWNSLYAILPDTLPEGHYIVTISGKDKEGNEQFVQKLIQMRNLSVYAQSADGDTLLWLNDAQAAEPMADRLLYLTDAEKTEDVREVTTQADGTARLMTGKMRDAYLSVMESGRVTYFEKLALSEQSDAPLSELYYTALYTDREIYQPDDTIRFWGVVKPRLVTSTLPGTVYAELGNGGDGAAPVYRIKLPVKPDGTFEGTVKISGMAQNYYNLSITNGEEGSYTAHYLRVENYTKPPFVITAEPEKDYYYADEPIKLNVSAAYFDGTPVAGGKLRLTGYNLGLDNESPDGVLTLDAQGKGSITAKYSERVSNPDWLTMWMPANVWFEISNADAEDVYISTSGNVTVLPSRVVMKVESETPEQITIYSAQLDPARLSEPPAARPLAVAYETEYDRLKGASVDLPITVELHMQEYKQVPVGSYYDYVNKKMITKYRVESSEKLVQTLQTQTVGGKVTLPKLPYENKGADSFYWLEVKFDGGVSGKVQESFHYGERYRERQGTDRKQYTFVPTENSYPHDKAALDEEITLGLYENGVKIENKGTVLFSAVQRKALETGLFTTAEKKIRMAEEYLPNVLFAGAYFDGRHVYSIKPYYVAYNYDSKKLNVEVKADKESYKPGEKANLSLTLTDAAGKPTAGAACVGVVDEAVFALAPQELDLAEQVYQEIFSNNIQQKTSYTEYNLEAAAADMGGMGGGGGGETPLREEFVDTALFQSVEVGADGKASVTLTLPDNVTSWRVTAAAVTPDLKAGDSVSNTIATLPFYLQPLFTESYLEGDDVAFSAGSVGTAQKAGDKVDYTVTISDAQGVEVDKMTAAGRAGERAPFNFGKYDAGGYSLTMTGKSGGYSDAVKHDFAVIKQGLTVPVFQTMPLAEAGAVSSVRYPVRLSLYDERTEPYMTALQKLSAQDGDRTEVVAAAYRARVRANELLDEADRAKIPRDPRLDEMQDYESGVKPLAFAEADAATTSKMLIAAPELVNPNGAEQFLQNVLRDAAATPDDRVMAYMGLAALKKPVLLDITRLEGDPSLNVAQRLYLGVGLAKLGDFTGAQKIYDSLGGLLVTEGKVKYLENNGTADERLQNNAAALMLTAIISHPDADALMRYFNALDSDRAKSAAVLYNLETLAYLENFSLTEDGGAAKFSYTLDGKAQEAVLDGKGVQSFSLSREALAGADFKTISGKVYAGVSYIDYAANTEAPNAGKVSITKTYTPVGGALKTTGRAKVEIKVKFDPSAPSGCYSISDYIPSGMRYMASQGVNPRFDWAWGALENEGQQVRGFIYRHKESEDPLTRPEVVERLERGSISEEDVAEKYGAYENRDEYTLTYYVSASLAGEFITESAYITPHTEGISARSERGKLIIGS